MTETPTSIAPPTDRFAARRAEIVDAALRVIEREGLHAASVRAIAHEMGCTTGVLSHHFRTKDDLTALACDEVTKTIGRRITAAEPGGEPAPQLQRVALAFLPDDEDSVRAWAVWLHFLAAALKQPEMVERHRRATEAVRQHIADLLRSFKNEGLVGADLDADFEAAYLFAVLEGLGTDSFISPDLYGPQSFARFVSEHLNRLFAAHPPTTGASP